MNTYIHKKYTLIFLSIVLFFPFISCESFLDVDLPESQLIGATVFDDATTADAAMANIYADIRDNGVLSGSLYGLSMNLGLYSDELEFYSDPSIPGFYFYNNTLLPTNLLVGNYWGTAYNEIYAANAVYEGVEASSSLAEEDANRLKGEALFVRGLLHFYLVNLYGDIPYITSTDYNENSTVSRMPVDEVYHYILTDLEKAAEYLPESYYSTGRARPNKFTAIALSARLFLYKNDWAHSESEANLILNSGMYTIEQNPDAVFLKDSPEIIWQLPPALEGDATAEAYTFTIFSPPPALCALSSELLNDFDDGDLRKIFWMGEITDGESVWYYPKKYKQQGFEGISTEYSVIFRLAELYLIRAEARAHTGNLEGAKEDLNKIRLRAGLNATSAMTQTEIIQAINEERKREFFTEHGQRFFDLKRHGKLDEKLSPIKPGWNSTDHLFPLPENELSVNPNLQPQNPGY